MGKEGWNVPIPLFLRSAIGTAWFGRRTIVRRKTKLFEAAVAQYLIT